MERTDAIGHALIDYLNNNHNENITVTSSITEDDVIPVEYLFREINRFPKIEKKAIELCRGKVLDVGAGSGCHSLETQSRGLDVKAIDTSKGAVEVMMKRGVSKVEKIDFFELENQKFDTILFLMNGVGIAGEKEKLKTFLNKAKELLNDDGQLLLDSSDIKYMFEEDDGTFWIDLNSTYYGQVTYQMKYKNFETQPFSWLFVDFDTLKNEAADVGLSAEILLNGDNYDYLARLQKVSNV